MPRNERLILVPEQQRLLETFGAQIALALERVHFVEIAQATAAAHGLGAAAQLAARLHLARSAHTACRADGRGEQLSPTHDQRLSPEARRELAQTHLRGGACA